MLKCTLHTLKKHLPKYYIHVEQVEKYTCPTANVHVKYQPFKDYKGQHCYDKTIVFVALPIYTHIPNLKGLTKIFFKLSCLKGNLCGGGVTVLNSNYPRLSSRDRMMRKLHCLTFCITLLRRAVGQLSISSETQPVYVQNIYVLSMLV